MSTTDSVSPRGSVQFPKGDPIGEGSMETARLSTQLEGPTQGSKIEKNLDALSKKEGCTCGDVADAFKKAGKGALRGLAGLVGIPLYGAAALIGGGLSAAVFVVAGTLALPPALLGATIGVLGTFSTAGAKKGVQVGGGIGFMIPAVLSEIALGIPKLVLFHTVGRMGAGLTAFALTGGKEPNKAKELFTKLGEATFAVLKFLNGAEEAGKAKAK